MAQSLDKTILVERLNIAFDRARTRLGLSNDVDLARHWEVSAKTVSFWRNGHWSKPDRALIMALLHQEEQTRIAA